MQTVPFPPSNCVLTRIGIDYLKLKALASLKGSFSGFRLGDSSALILDQNVTNNVAGNVVYTGGSSELTYSIVGPHEIILTCTVEHDKGPFDIGSIALLSDSLIPVFVSRFEYIHKKEPTTTLQAGGRWVFSMKFIQYNILTYWDLSNLQQKQAAPVAHTLPWISVPERPIFSPESEQIQTDNISGVDTARKGYFLSPEIYDLDWTGSPFQMRLDDSDFWKIDGGLDGDNHKYNNITPVLPPPPIIYKTTILSTNQPAASSLNLTLKLENGGNYDIDWGTGSGWESVASNVLVTKVYTLAYNGIVKIRTPSTSIAKEFRSTVGHWNFNINSLPVGLTYYYNTGSNTTTGSIASLPVGLTFYSNTGSNTTTGSIASLPVGLTYYDNEGSNTTTGSIASLPVGLTFYSNTGSNTTTGSINSLPVGLTYYYNAGLNTTSGSINSLPVGLTVYSNRGSNTTSGSINSLPVGLTLYSNTGSNTTTGSINSLPVGLTYYYNAGSNTTTGSIASLPVGLTVYSNLGSNTTSGSINSLPVGLTYYVNQGFNTTNATSTAWNSSLTGFRYFVNYGAPSTRTPAQVDMTLQALSNINSWATEKYVGLNSTANATPTGVGLAARTTILTKGALTVLTN